MLEEKISRPKKKHKNERNQNLVEIVKEGAQVTKEGRRKKRDI